MAVADVPLPVLGDDAGDEARVSFWYVDVGEKVAEGADVPSPVAGKIVKLSAAEEQTVKVGQVLCQIEVGGR
jgi:pyruvate/2-oxoglutarate dehydrogenase complex dihydrolipoamide acyltransferase (E2) component